MDNVNKTMKTGLSVKQAFNLAWIGIVALALIVINQGCQKSSLSVPATNTPATELKITDSSTFTQVNLVADVPQYGAQYIDSNLQNAWGLALSDENEFWVNAANTGVSNIYGQDGQTLDPDVTIPSLDSVPAIPTGIVYNETSDFVITATNETAEFIFATVNGTIAAWASGTTAILVADRTAAEAEYTGLAMGQINGANYLYAANFHGAAIDVFDGAFNYVGNITFTDPNLPADYAPFNVVNVDGQLFVAYAKQELPDKDEEEQGPGLGLVDVYNTDGSFVKRYTTFGSLNAPWGMAAVPGHPGAMLVGNLGDGKINIFDVNGNYASSIMTTSGDTLVIEGLWAIVFPEKSNGDVRKRLYFTAGPEDETHGLFGYLRVDIE